MRKDYISIITSHLLTGKLKSHSIKLSVFDKNYIGTNVIKIQEAKYQHLDFLSQMFY